MQLLGIFLSSTRIKLKYTGKHPSGPFKNFTVSCSKTCRTSNNQDIEFEQALLNSFLASDNLRCLLIDFPNSLDPDQDRQNVDHDLEPNPLTH